MPKEPKFESASPYQGDILELPVKDIEQASEWYTRSFGMTEAVRRSGPDSAVIMERDGVRIGFCTNGGDPSQEGAAILVTNIAAIRVELESRGVTTANWRVDERDGESFQVFFVIAPDGLCYYFHEPLEEVGRL